MDEIGSFWKGDPLDVAERTLRHIVEQATWQPRSQAWYAAGQHVGMPPTAQDACHDIKWYATQALRVIEHARKGE